MQDFPIKFELSRNTCSSYEVEIPDKIVAYQMLESANLPMMKKEVVKTTLTTYTADNMRSQILKIFSEEDVPNVSGHHDHTHIKSEPEEEVNVALFGSSGQKNRKGRRRDKPNYKQQANYSDNEGTLKTNPVDEFGEITTCDFCSSIYHYVPKCPDKRKSRKTGRKSGYQRKSYNPSLWLDGGAESVFLSDPREDHDAESFVSECLGSALLDSGCPTTVCGSLWLKVYIDSLSAKQKQLIEVSPCHKKYKFGNGKEVQAVETAIIPVFFGKIKSFLTMDVIPVLLPLLLSKSSLQRGKAEINFENNTLTILGQKLPLHETKSGHLLVSLCQRRH